MSNGAAPALLAALASFGIAELLTGSTRPVVLLSQPLLVVGLVVMYGCGVVAVHELAQRLHGGWVGVLLLGGAYGVVEEGLVARSFFDPGWADLGTMAGYGRIAGVNTAWTVYLIVFHAVFTVAIPIALANIAFPAQRDKPWMRRRGLVGILGGWFAVVALGTAVLNPGAGNPAALLLTVAAATATLLATVLLGRYRRRKGRRAGEQELAISPLRLGILGLAGTSILLALLLISPTAGVPPELDVAAIGLLALTAAAVGRRLTVHRATTASQQLALVTGALVPWVLLALASTAQRPDTAVVAFAAGGALGLANIRIRRTGVTPA